MTSPTEAPVEKKVTVATIAAFVVGVLIAILNAVQANPDLLGGLPTWLQSLLLVLIPTLATFGGGYLAPHTPRGINERGRTEGGML